MDIINIKDFGAHSIDESGYENFDSSTAINNAIQYAKNNGYSALNFGSGRFYANGISLESDMCYYSTGYCELITEPNAQINDHLINISGKQHIALSNIRLNGNKDVVAGSDQAGVVLISVFDSSDIIISKNVLHDNKYLAILLVNSKHVTVDGNTIYETDCGIATMGAASNFLNITNNEIYGGVNQQSEPISIYSDDTIQAHDILIKDNILHDKNQANGILVGAWSRAISIIGNIIFNCAIGVGFDSGQGSGKVGKPIENIHVSDNLIYGCHQGIGGNTTKTAILNNTIYDISGSGIWFGYHYFDNEYLSIKGNNIRDVNSDNNGDDCIRLGGTMNSTISQNDCRDTRTTPLNHQCIAMIQNSANNYIINNGKAEAAGSFTIYLDSSTHDNYMWNNAMKPYDEGTNNIVKNIINTWDTSLYRQVVSANNVWLHDSEFIGIVVGETPIEIDTIITPGINKKVTLVFVQSSGNILLKSGIGNLKLNGDFQPANDNVSNITLLSVDSNWIEISRLV